MSNDHHVGSKRAKGGQDTTDKVSHADSAGSSGEFEAFSFPDDQGLYLLVLLCVFWCGGIKDYL